MWRWKVTSRVFSFNCCLRCYANIAGVYKKTYYEILNVRRTASQEEIRESFLKLSKLLHPDTAVGNEKDTHNAFILLSEAYTVLSKPALRKTYDRKLQGIVQVPKRPMQHPHRTTNYKDPYIQYDKTRNRAENWTDYYGTHGRKRARHRMQQDLDNDFWQKYWQFSRDHGGGGPKVATHNYLNKRKNIDIGYVLLFALILVALSMWVMVSTEQAKKDIKSINDDYYAWLLEQFSREKPEKLVKPEEIFK